MAPTSEHETLMRDQPLGILATAKKDGTPQLSPIYYAYEDGQILISITKTRAKYHNIKRSPQVSICIVKAEGRPYVTVYGRAEIEEQDIADDTAKIYKRFSDRALPEDFEQNLRDQQRVVVKITPEQFIP
jgi:PPOX class probable F420-dependent enzyme